MNFEQINDDDDDNLVTWDVRLLIRLLNTY